MAGYELKKKQLIKPDLQKLLKHLTDFKEDESEFKQCENFALSHFLHHTYLSVNRHQVQRSINGLINKFYVRGFTDKAKRLEMLVEKFVTSERYKDHEEVDVQWSILLFLMNLSDNPTSMILQEDINPLPDLIPPDKENVSEVQPFVNWGDYLKEGWEEFQLPDDEVDSINWSDLESDDDLDELSLPLETSLTFQFTDKPVSSDVSISSDKKSESIESHLKPLERDFESECDLKMKDYEQRLLSESWLKQNLQYDWWNDTSVRMKPKSNLPSARFAIIWEEHEHKHTQGLIPLGSISLISEYKLIREVLWVLQVPNDTFMFHLTNDGRIIPRDNISIPSVTPESLSSYLKINICYYAEIIYNLSQFISDIEKAEFEPKKPPYTYQTYAQTLHEQLLRIFANVAKIEEKVDVQETTCTLVSVIEELRPSLSKLPYLHCLHKMAVCDWRRSEGWFSSTRLLATLYEEVYISWKDEFAAIAMELFVKSFRVYLQISDLWLSEGKLDDWRDEFIIKRFDGALRTVAYEAALKEIKKTRIIEIFSVVEKAGCDLEYIRKLDEISVLSTKVENKGCLCKEFLEALGRDLGRFKSTIDSEGEEPLRSSEIVLGISNSASYLEETKSNFNESCHRLRHSATLPSLSLPASELDSSWYDLATKNLLSSPWLDMSFKFLLCSEKRQTVLSKNEYRDTVGKYSSKDIGTLPLHHIIEKHIIHLFMERQRIASKIMVETLLTKYKLKQHLAILGGVFILEASYIVQRFYKRLFSPIMPNNIERAEYSMDVVLEECVESITTQELATDIHFSVNFIENPNLISHNIIECINIDYKVDLPLSIIITKESLLIYNSVFKFLLKIEWALSSLHELRFSDLKETKSNQERIRLLYKLRMFLMHCVTTLHSYFVAFTPKELRSELDQALDQAATVDDILNAHNNYLQKLKTHCLMDKGNIIMKAVKKLLIMCGDLKSYWIKESEGALTTDELSVLEDDYTKAHVRLHIVLKHTVGQHSNSSLRLLSSDIERCLPVSLLSFTGQGDQIFQVDY